MGILKNLRDDIIRKKMSRLKITYIWTFGN